MNYSAFMKRLLRQGYYIIENPYDMNLGVFKEICAHVPFDCELKADAYKDGQWAIICKEILEERHNCFWHGLGITFDEDAPIENPTQWIIDWQNRRNKHEH